MSVFDSLVKQIEDYGTGWEKRSIRNAALFMLNEKIEPTGEAFDMEDFHLPFPHTAIEFTYWPKKLAAIPGTRFATTALISSSENDGSCGYVSCTQFTTPVTGLMSFWLKGTIGPTSAFPPRTLHPNAIGFKGWAGVCIAAAVSKGAESAEWRGPGEASAEDFQMCSDMFREVVGTVLHILCKINDRERLIVQVDNKESGKTHKMIPRAHQRRTYTLLTVPEIRVKLGLARETPGSTERKTAPHWRRGHWHHYFHERFKNKKGQKQWIDALWSGPTEAEVGGKKYKIRLDL